jgi:hypothetical protein
VRRGEKRGGEGRGEEESESEWEERRRVGGVCGNVREQREVVVCGMWGEKNKQGQKSEI